MAQGYYEKLYKTVKSGNEKAIAKAFSQTNAGKQSKLQSQIDNLSTRMDASGVNTSEAKDSRNPIEKLLGLKENQNFIFDIFELLNRPQQALFGAIDAAQKGEDVLGGAWQNFKGDKETSFKQILNNAGLEDKEGLDLSDVLGFAGDVFLDPLDLAILPVSGVAKGAKALDTASDVAKSGVKFKSANDLIFEGAGKAAKGLAKAADTGIEKALTKAVKNAKAKNTYLGCPFVFLTISFATQVYIPDFADIFTTIIIEISRNITLNICPIKFE